MSTRSSSRSFLGRRSERGYILIALMLMVTLLVVFALSAVQVMKFEVRRDREEEMVHRGVQYARAVKKYYKKYGSYPPTLEALEKTQNLRFLRKRYKDPVNRDKDGKEQDFKILRMNDVPGLGASIALGAAVQNAALGQAGGLGQNAGLGGQNAQVAAAIANQAVASTSGATNPFNSLNANQNQNPAQGQGQGQSQDQADAGQTPSANPNAPGGPGSDNSGNPNPNGNSPFVSASGQSTGGTIGGLPIVGVVSARKDESIRVFAKKNHYNDWKFVYDPGSDKGGLLNAPVQPGLQQGVAPAQTGFGNPANQGSTSPFSSGPGANPSNPGLQPGTGGSTPQN